MARFFITTPIYYVNDAPHVGHAYATVNADALARWHRMIGDDVLFLTGTDEHGLKVAQAADEAGVSPKEWTDRTAQRFIDAWSGLDISNDDFIRTTEDRHHRTVRKFLSEIYDNGFIVPGIFSGLYCVSCEAYYNVSELEDGQRCPIHHRPVIEMEEENYFFKLSSFEDKLIEWYTSIPDVVLPEAKRNEALSFIKGGLHDISITRTSLSWGVPVPWDEKHVFYVWYDALVNYLTAVGYGEDDDEFAAWWPAVHHLIGKEILRFHCVWWPAMCMAAGIEPPASIFVHGWLLVGGEKLSKTLMKTGDSGEGVAQVKLTQVAPDLLTADFGVDAIRYHLLRDTPLGSDGEFSYESIVKRYNSDLANNLGNLVSRVTTVVGSKCGGIAPEPSSDSELASAAKEAVYQATLAWEKFAPHGALEATWALIGATNAALEESEPWKLDPGPEVDQILGNSIEALRIIALLIHPAMPATAAEIWSRLGLHTSPGMSLLPRDASWGKYPGGLKVEKKDPMFPRRKQ